MTTRLIVFLFCAVFVFKGLAGIYVSPTGSDSNSGTLALPYATIAAAVSKVTAGDTIYVRGGSYKISSKISITKSGTASSYYHMFAYNNEKPVIDGSSMSISSSNRGISLSGSYWHIKGISIYKTGDNGMNVTGSNNIIEFCSFYENGDSGLQLSVGASNNQIVNCDSYYNRDTSDGNADGFSPKLDVGTGNYFYGCRSWQNSDDGYDGYLRPADDITTTYENCWCFANGYLKSGSKSSGNGNGFKMGGSDNKDLRHNAVLKRCLSFYNRVKGFDQNNDKGSMTLVNCTAYSNGTNFAISLSLASGKTATVENCASLGAANSLGSFVVQTTNGWTSPLSTAVSDFISTDTTGVRGSRKSDGSLPDLNFMRLKSTSALIDAGTTYTGISYSGLKPDIGCFETSSTTGIEKTSMTNFRDFTLEQNYPNPFNPSTRITFNLPMLGNYSLRVYNTLGQEVSVLFNEQMTAGTYSYTFNASNLPSGIYFCRLAGEDMTLTRKMNLVK
jgi:hypothetical protein